MQTFYRLIAGLSPTTWDFLSQAARRQPSPRTDPEFLARWRGLSVFDTYEAARELGVRFNWRHGAYIAVLEIPDEAPFLCTGPDYKGHWLLYDRGGGMIREDGADLLRLYVVRIVHGPSTRALTL